MGCSKCKKKQPVTELPPLVVEPVVPSIDEIKTLYVTMSSANGMTKEQYEEVNQTYKNLFQEDLKFGCGSCGQQQFRKLKYYVEEVLKLKI